MRINFLKKISNVWLISYLIVLIFPLIISTVTYIKVEKILVEQIHNYNMQMLENKRKDIDAVIDEVVNMATDLSMRPEFLEYVNQDADFTLEKKFQMAGIRDRYLKKFVINTKISDLYIYYPKSDLIFGVSDIGNAKEFYDKKIGNQEGVNFERWYGFVRSHETKGFYKLGDKVYYQYVPLNETIRYENMPAIIIVMDPQAFLTIKDMKDEDSIFILDKQNNLFLCSSEEKAEAFSDQVKVNPEFTHRMIQNYKNSKKYIMSYVASQRYNWNYVYITDENKYLSQANYTRSLMYWTIAGCFIIGMILIVFSVKRNQKPILELVNRLRKYRDNENYDTNEYQYIDSVVMETINKNEEYSKRLYRQKKFLIEDVLSKLIMGNIGNREDISARLKSLDIDFSLPYFIVTYFFIEDVSNIFFENGEETPEKFAQAKFITTNIMEEMLKKHYRAYIICCNGNLICIINMDQEQAENLKLLEDIIFEGRNFILNNFNFDFVTSISSVHETFHGIYKGYEEAKEGMEYKFLRWQEPIISYDSISQTPHSGYYYPLEKEQFIIDCIKKAEYERCHSEINLILDVNFKEIHISLQLSRCLMFNITSTFLKAVDEIGALSNNDFFEKTKIVERITTCETVAKMREEIFSLIEELFSYIKKNISGCSNQMIEKVIQFINSYYYDDKLSVALIADKFYINANYLSNLFKKEMGVGILEYISKYRIEKAKDIMGNSDENLEGIAQKAGFNNPRTFLRVFKKYEGMPPGKYRQVYFK